MRKRAAMMAALVAAVMATAAAQAAPFEKAGGAYGTYTPNQPTWLDQLEAVGCYSWESKWGWYMCWEEEVEVTRFICMPDGAFDPGKCLGLPPAERFACLMEGRRRWVGGYCPSTETRRWSFDEETCEYTYDVVNAEESQPGQCLPAGESDVTQYCRDSGGAPPPPQEVVVSEWSVSCK